MTEEETNQNTNESNQNTNFTEPTPVNTSIADNNPPTTPNNPRRKKKPITVKVIQEKSNHPKIANWISGISAAISLLLGVITIGLYFEAKNATKLTHDALSHQITKDSGDNINRMHKDTIDSIAEAKKLKRDTDFINKQKSGIDAQIEAIKETQKQFIISHSPYITVKEFSFRDNDLVVEITNAGTQIASVLEQNVSIGVDTPKRGFKTSEEMFKWLPIKRTPFNFQTLISPSQEILFPAPLNDISASGKQKTKKGIYVFFIRVVVYYFNTATEKTMKYESVYKFNPAGGDRALLYFKYSILKKYP